MTTKDTSKDATRRTQSERKAESEKQLIAAARRLFARQGYMRTTVNEVGKEAGYTGPLVSARFGSKQELLKAVVKHIAVAFRRDQVDPAVDQPTAKAALENYIELYMLEVPNMKVTSVPSTPSWERPSARYRKSAKMSPG